VSPFCARCGAAAWSAGSGATACSSCGAAFPRHLRGAPQLDRAGGDDQEPNTTGSLLDEWPTTTDALHDPRRRPRLWPRPDRLADDWADLVQPPHDPTGRLAIDRTHVLMAVVVVAIIAAVAYAVVAGMADGRAGTDPPPSRPTTTVAPR